MARCDLWSRTVEAVADGVATARDFSLLPVLADSLEDAGWMDSCLPAGTWTPWDFGGVGNMIRVFRHGNKQKDREKELFHLGAIANTNGWRHEQPGTIYDMAHVPVKGHMPYIGCPQCGQRTLVEMTHQGKCRFVFHERMILVQQDNGKVRREAGRCPGSENGFVRAVGKWEEANE